ncbi:hypothetical protein AMAG_19465 [Allomyces macrogynus ATCC 38327]|uniref:Uncharacterized protein n=1 Tax=Allomyces macrogynus (strain ATCC 38327) TaxID=578462 RepID=A0A0L0SSE3_ALLM3|nr:hypothetical protein AMAG_19465 [Allomyces macrogynus ATCC 38327]|eukprot:KNE65432.1 hypothetical protein AMAG_19465 [Allomyces macrogynus ATCC 38327]
MSSMEGNTFSSGGFTCLSCAGSPFARYEASRLRCRVVSWHASWVEVVVEQCRGTPAGWRSLRVCWGAPTVGQAFVFVRRRQARLGCHVVLSNPNRFPIQSRRLSVGAKH